MGLSKLQKGEYANVQVKEGEARYTAEEGSYPRYGRENVPRYRWRTERKGTLPKKGVIQGTKGGICQGTVE